MLLISQQQTSSHLPFLWLHIDLLFLFLINYQHSSLCELWTFLLGSKVEMTFREDQKRACFLCPPWYNTKAEQSDCACGGMTIDSKKKPCVRSKMSFQLMQLIWKKQNAFWLGEARGFVSTEMSGTVWEAGRKETSLLHDQTCHIFQLFSQCISYHNTWHERRQTVYRTPSATHRRTRSQTTSTWHGRLPGFLQSSC